MITLALLLVLAALLFMSISLQKSYGYLPLKELKRRVRANDEAAEILYRGAAYGRSLRLLLWLISGLCGAAWFLILARGVDSILIVTAAGSVMIWAAFAWFPGTRPSHTELRLALVITPIMTWLLRQLYPVLDRLTWLGVRFGRAHIHTSLFQKEDIIELLKNQQLQVDNRVSLAEFQLATNALTFGDKLVSEYLIPKRVVKTVLAKDSVGPVLMDELHDSGFSRFPVRDGKGDNIVGTLYLRDLVGAAGGGKISDIMRPEVYYIHQDQTLYDALKAVINTNHQLLIVVDSFEEFVGIISLDDILAQIIGGQIIHDTDQDNHANLRDAAKRMALKDHNKHTKKTD